MKKGLVIGILVGLIIGFIIGVVVAFIYVKSTFSEAREKSMMASIKASMSSAVPAGIICEGGDGKVLSGKGGDEICDNKVGTWPSIDFCGSNSTDTSWTVLDGGNNNWNFTLSCKGFTNCNGPQNAICDKDGCEFSGSCE